jgi:hypothetical protein
LYGVGTAVTVLVAIGAVFPSKVRCLFFIPIVAFFLFDKLQDLGLLPDNKKPSALEDSLVMNILTEPLSWSLKDAMGLQSVCSGVVWPDYYGMKHLGSIRGVSMTAGVLASAL